MKLLVLLSALLLIGCSSTELNETKKSAIENASTWGSEIVAISASCENKEAIKLDIKEELESLQWLKPRSKSVGGDLCRAAVSGVIPKFVNYATKQLPVRWNCSGKFVESIGVTFTEKICSKL